MTEDQLRVRKFKKQNVTKLKRLQQNRLLSESELISFGRDRGIPVRGVLDGDPGELFRREWLRGDGFDGKRKPLFHPFRIYPLYMILGRSPSVQTQTTETANVQSLAEQTVGWNATIDLASLLEPVFWPGVVGHLSLTAGEQSHRAELENYKVKVLRLVEQLDIEEWLEVHASVRRDAAWMDNNPDLYLLLRLSTWEARSRLTGRISGSLWFRHIAEVIRRAFEEARGVQWHEEDLALGRWPPGGRRHAFGSERPLDDEFRAKPYLAYRFGLFTGSAVRWYAEGDTEFYAIESLLPEPHKVGIEFVNLKGAIAEGKNNAAMKLSDMLAQDRLLRRFSILWFDLDVEANKRAIRHLISNEHIVGSVAANRPDFEFANFTVEELAEIAARIDESHGFCGTSVRTADWSGVDTGKKFETRYVKVSERKAGSIKGEEWGKALAAYANEQLRRPDGARRPLWNEISAALYSWNSDYDYEVAHFRLDPNTFVRMPR